MTLCKQDTSEIAMRYRIFNRGLKFLLMFLIIVATLVVVQLFFYCDSFHLDSGQTSVQTIWPHLGEHHGKAHDIGISGRGLRSKALYDLSMFTDSKYNQLKIYHNKGLALRGQFDCRKLFENDVSEQQKVGQFHKQNANIYPVVDNENVPAITADCEAFRTVRGYRTDHGSSTEREFPLAYIILVHMDFEHLEKLLRTIYMPQHSICIHVDNKAPDSLKRAVSSLARCFDNVIVATKPQDIFYAHMSRLLADLGCMKDLLQKKTSWRYLINYAATEFPLRTNLETVKILQILHGLNDIHEQFSRRLEDRFTRQYEIVDGRMKQTHTLLPPPPYNMTIIKGQAYNTYGRAFVEWVVTDEKPRQFLAWSNKTFSPDEHYWASLNDLYHNAFLETPGGFKGHPDKKGYITRFISWQYSKPKFKCHGKSIRNICIFSALDLPILMKEMHLAANKFDLTYDPVAYSCMEELIENKTLAQLPFNLHDYSRLYFIKFNSSSS